MNGDGDNLGMRDIASRICRNALQGEWKKVNAHSIGFKRVSGGLSNLLYHISLPSHSSCDDTKSKQRLSMEPKEVLLRIYGQAHDEGTLDDALFTESMIFTSLGEKGLGPKLHGIFPGGRIEQYINARPLLATELADETLSVQIARKMAMIHSMDMPLPKKPDWLWNTIDRWLRVCDKKLKMNVPGFVKDLLKNVDLSAEVKWLKERLEQENSPVVFCHNDMNEGNILMRIDECHSKIMIIDFEYSSYNYRGFDLANHFIEWVYDYKMQCHPFYKEDHANYPNEKQRLMFIRSYLSTRGSHENPKKVLKEVEVFTLASHFFWTLWGFTNAETSPISFGFWEYSCSRLSSYFELKERLMQIDRRDECLSISSLD